MLGDIVFVIAKQRGTHFAAKHINASPHPSAMTASLKKLALERYVFDSQTKQPQNHFRALEKWLLFPASEVK